MDVFQVWVGAGRRADAQLGCRRQKAAGQGWKRHLVPSPPWLSCGPGSSDALQLRLLLPDVPAGTCSLFHSHVLPRVIALFA